MLEAMLLLNKSGAVGGPGAMEVAQADFITITALFTEVGLSAGTPINPTTPWIRIEDNGKVLYVAKQPVVHTVTREQLHALGVVLGTKVITVNGKQYKVRCFKGRDSDPSSTSGGEQVYYFTRLTNGIWKSYTNEQLSPGYPNNGGITIMQEADPRGGWACCGYPTLLGSWYITPDTTNSYYGWRPVLEEI